MQALPQLAVLARNEDTRSDQSHVSLLRARCLCLVVLLHCILKRVTGDSGTGQAPDETLQGSRHQLYPQLPLRSEEVRKEIDQCPQLTIDQLV